MAEFEKCRDRWCSHKRRHAHPVGRQPVARIPVIWGAKVSSDGSAYVQFASDQVKIERAPHRRNVTQLSMDRCDVESLVAVLTEALRLSRASN